MGRGWVVLGLSSLLFGCGGGDGDPIRADGNPMPEDGNPISDDGNPTSSGDPDASSDGRGPVSCPAPDFGDLGAVYEAGGYQFAQDIFDPEGPQLRGLTGEIGEGHNFMLTLWDGRGFFTGGAVEIGTYTLSSEQLDLEACGACLAISFGDDKTGIFMQAMAGTLTLDSVDGELVGSAADLTLQNIDFVNGGVPGDCFTTVASLSFSAVLQL